MSGTQIPTAAPPARRLRASTLPPCAAATSATIDSPSPLPGSDRALSERWNRSKINSSSACSIPGPRSLTSIDSPSATASVAAVVLTVTSTGVPTGENLQALSTRFRTARAIRSRRHTTPVGVSEPANPMLTERPQRLATRSDSARVSATMSTSSGSWSDSTPPATSSTSSTSLDSSSASASRSATTLPTVAGSISCTPRNENRFVRNDVMGVRNSWPASCTRRRWRSEDRANDESISSNARPSRPVSSSPSRGTSAWRSPDDATLSAAEVSRVSRSVIDRASRAPTRPDTAATAADTTRILRRSDASTRSTSSRLRAAIKAPRESPSDLVRMREETPCTASSRNSTIPAWALRATSRSVSETGSDGPSGPDRVAPSGPRYCRSISRTELNRSMGATRTGAPRAGATPLIAASRELSTSSCRPCAVAR